jgi:hypothetical protein
LVKVGDPKIQVEDKCGPPASKETVAKVVEKTPWQERTIYREEWIYDHKSNYYNILTFEGNRLIKIEHIRK